ncbi:MAG: sulfite exporter TauE/SafE family protein [bacterium]|nr:sulfite exporter TauE/SafE family protein [bacterium]
MEIFFFIIIVILASLVGGTVGFGSNLIAMPLILTFLAKEPAISSMAIANIVLGGFLIRKIPGKANLRLGAILFLSSLAGMPIGIWILKVIPMEIMKVLVGSLAIFFVLAVCSGKIRLPKSVFLTSVAGFFSGLLSTSTNMSGPPVVLLLMGQDIPKDEFRKTLTAFFLSIGIVSLLLFFANQIVNSQGAVLGLIAAPFVILGAFFGNMISEKLPQKLFRFLAMAIVLLSGACGIFSGLR